MPRRVILDHHLDGKANVYRIMVGLVEEALVGVFDEDGEPVMLPDTQVFGVERVDPDTGGIVYDEKAPRLDQNGDPVVLPGEQMTERQQVILDADEVLFTADDPQWDGMSDEDVAAEQRSQIRAALDEQAAARETAHRARMRSRRTLPGIGEEL